jgi:hypothetical protein
MTGSVVVASEPQLILPYCGSRDTTCLHCIALELLPLMAISGAFLPCPDEAQIIISAPASSFAGLIYLTFLHSLVNLFIFFNIEHTSLKRHSS